MLILFFLIAMISFFFLIAIYPFLDKSLKKAILLESFLDSDAACLRVNNLMQSPVNESFQQIFSVYDFKVLGEVNAALRNTLEGWKPSYLSYEAGFNKKI